jgi:hypothetical protein
MTAEEFDDEASESGSEHAERELTLHPSASDIAANLALEQEAEIAALRAQVAALSTVKPTLVPAPTGPPAGQNPAKVGTSAEAAVQTTVVISGPPQKGKHTKRRKVTGKGPAAEAPEKTSASKVPQDPRLQIKWVKEREAASRSRLEVLKAQGYQARRPAAEAPLCVPDLRRAIADVTQVASFRKLSIGRLCLSLVALANREDHKANAWGYLYFYFA